MSDCELPRRLNFLVPHGDLMTCLHDADGEHPCTAMATWHLLIVEPGSVGTTSSCDTHVQDLREEFPVRSEHQFDRWCSETDRQWHVTEDGHSWCGPEESP